MLEVAVANSSSFSGVLRYLGSGVSGSVHGYIKKRIISYNIDYSHFSQSKGNCGGGPRKKTVEDILVVIPPEVSTRHRRQHLLYAMLASDIEYKCDMEDCPNPSPVWRGQKLALEIDHVDGNWRNCLLENVRFVCPNCHSQTPSNTRSQAIFGNDVDDFQKAITLKQEKYRDSKKKTCNDCDNVIHGNSIRCRSCQNKVPRLKKIEYPQAEFLIQNIKSSSYRAVAKELGVSDSALRKHLKRNGYDPKTFKLTGS